MAQQAKKRLAALGFDWFCVNDLVMGGKSSSQVERTSEGALRFSGAIDTNGGGFASCRTANTSVDAGNSSGVVLEVSGDLSSHVFKFTIAARSVERIDPATLGDGMRGRRGANWVEMTDEQKRIVIEDINWQCSLPTSAADVRGRSRVHLPFSRFTASLYGQRMKGLTMDTSTISRFGINAGVFDADGNRDSRYAAGPFDMTLHAIGFR